MTRRILAALLFIQAAIAVVAGGICILLWIKLTDPINQE